MDGKSILVTGGTGSFGRAFIKMVLREMSPDRIIVFSRDELKQHEMQMGGYDHQALRYFVGDVRDLQRLKRAMKGADIVIHAAALKQVPACEYNPIEAILTNIIGARNVIDAALDCGVKNVLALSTDKAVNPVNLYGATKLCSEKLFIQSNAYSGTGGTRFSCVRYGNVIGSRGSVVPTFIKQRDKGCLTITDKRMTRFWVTLDQGVKFVFRCMSIMHGGEVFVPKLPSLNIMDLAKAIAPESDVRFIGIRAGEKLHEILISENEAHHTIELDDMFVIQPLHPWWDIENWDAGRALDDGFEYSSDKNDSWLGIEELKHMVEEFELRK